MRPTWVTCPRCLPVDPDGFLEQYLTSDEIETLDDDLNRERYRRVGRSGPVIIPIRAAA